MTASTCPLCPSTGLGGVSKPVAALCCLESTSGGEGIRGLDMGPAVVRRRDTGRAGPAQRCLRPLRKGTGRGGARAALYEALGCWWVGQAHTYWGLRRRAPHRCGCGCASLWREGSPPDSRLQREKVKVVLAAILNVETNHPHTHTHTHTHDVRETNEPTTKKPGVDAAQQGTRSQGTGLQTPHQAIRRVQGMRLGAFLLRAGARAKHTHVDDSKRPHTHIHTYTHTHTHTHTICNAQHKALLARQLVIRQDKQSVSNANRRLSAVQGAETRTPGDGQ